MGGGDRMVPFEWEAGEGSFTHKYKDHNLHKRKASCV